ncbi:hypothetical protein V2J09_009255 [Rumex salicifolius]
MADDDESLLEGQLELQLHEQRDSLSAIKDALVADPTNSELIGIEEELISAIKDAEEGLFHLKRARLLQEVDFAYANSTSTAKETDVEPLGTTYVEAEPLEKPDYAVGSKCRFRHTDGRWYSGQIIELQGSSAKVSFLTPTSESMLTPTEVQICKFFLQQRCRFGASCRLSHGVNVPVSSLRKFLPIIWEQSMVGSSIWAVSDSKAEIWREAELKSWDDKINQFEVVFRHDGSTEKLGMQSIALSELAQASEEEEESGYSSSKESNSSESEEESSPQGLGFAESTAMKSGVQKETVIFAKWENHTRGIASKMMANMGYREGMGLGASGQGMVEPIPVKVLPPKQSLDHALWSSQKGESEGENNNIGGQKKRSRGGKRKRDKKFAEAARAAKEEEEPTPDMFSFINDQLALHAEATNGSSGKKQRKKEEARKEDRQSLVAYEDEVKELKVQVQKLEEMVNRNRKEKVVYEAAMRKLTETRKALEVTEASHASASHAVMSKEKEKRWLKILFESRLDKPIFKTVGESQCVEQRDGGGLPRDAQDGNKSSNKALAEKTITKTKTEKSEPSRGRSEPTLSVIKKHNWSLLAHLLIPTLVLETLIS